MQSPTTSLLAATGSLELQHYLSGCNNTGRSAPAPASVRESMSYPPPLRLGYPHTSAIKMNSLELLCIARSNLSRMGPPRRGSSMSEGAPFELLGYFVTVWSPSAEAQRTE